MPINIFTTIDDPLATGDITVAADINESGQIVGLFESADFSAHGFVLSSGSFTTLDVPTASDTRASGINAAGQIVGRFEGSGGKVHGFFFNGNIFAVLDAPSNPAAPRP